MNTSEQPADPSRPARARARGLRDVAIRVVGIPFFGLLIPRMTGVFGALGWRQQWYWAGTAGFLGLSLLIWQGNRWLLLRRRDRADWLAEPGKKLLGLLLAHVLYTAPVTTIAMVLWYAAGPFPAVDWSRVALVTGVVVTAVLLVAHGYETVFLIQDRLEDRLDLEQTERARLLAELAMVKSQLAPHFLFNCLHTLGVLITEDPAKARAFNQHMADVCRYLLTQQRRDLVPLTSELAFFHAYAGLTRLRHPGSIKIELRNLGTVDGLLIPPASLQLLLENAIKHNAFSEAVPLRVEVCLAGATVTVSNPRRPHSAPPPSARVGLRNLRERYLLAAGAEIAVEKTPASFRVTLPLVRAARPADTRAAPPLSLVRN